MVKIICLLTILTVVLFITNVETSFFDYGWDTRGEGLSGAYTAVSDTGGGIFYNPAGIGYVRKKSVEMMFSRPYLGTENVDITLLYLSFIYPVLSSKTKNVNLVFGINYNSYLVSSVYDEQMVILPVSVKLKLSDIIPYFTFISFGTNFKYLQKRYNWDDELRMLNDNIVITNPGGKVYGYGMDIGCILERVYRLKIGLAVRNIVSPNMGILQPEYIPTDIRGSIAYIFGDILFFEDIMLISDIGYRIQSWGEINNKLILSIGLESGFNYKTVVIRTGVSKDKVSFGLGVQKIVRKSTLLNIDYTFNIPFKYNITKSFGTHKVSFRVSY